MAGPVLDKGEMAFLVARVFVKHAPMRINWENINVQVSVGVWE